MRSAAQLGGYRVEMILAGICRGTMKSIRVDTASPVSREGCPARFWLLRGVSALRNRAIWLVVSLPNVWVPSVGLMVLLMAPRKRMTVVDRRWVCGGFGLIRP